MSREITASLAAKSSQGLTFPQLNQIHAQLVVLNSLHRQIYWASCLISHHLLHNILIAKKKIIWFGVFFQAIVEKLGFFKDPYVRNVMIVMYGNESVESARKLFDEITQRKVSNWNAMVFGYWRCGKKDEACKLLISCLRVKLMSFLGRWWSLVVQSLRIWKLQGGNFDRMREESVVIWNAMLFRLCTELGLRRRDSETV